MVQEPGTCVPLWVRQQEELATRGTRRSKPTSRKTMGQLRDLLVCMLFCRRPHGRGRLQGLRTN